MKLSRARIIWSVSSLVVLLGAAFILWIRSHSDTEDFVEGPGGIHLPKPEIVPEAQTSAKDGVVSAAGAVVSSPGTNVVPQMLVQNASLVPTEILKDARAGEIAATENSKPFEQPFSEENAKKEEAATTQMYLAHSSLRTKEVADPDSLENRRIMQLMVQKGLARTQQPSAR